MKKQRPGEKETGTYQCCVCEEISSDFQVCCGHPMMNIENEEDVVLDLKRQGRKE